MTDLTPTEKDHWHDRLALLIEEALARLTAEDPGLLRRVQREARRRAWQSLGLSELQAESAALAARAEELAAGRRRLHRAMLAVVRRVPVDEVAEDAAADLPAEVVEAVRSRQAAHEEELLAEDERGRLLLRLRRERQALPDTVWLAGSAPAMQAVWRQVVELLGREPTPLQQQALATGATGGP